MVCHTRRELASVQLDISIRHGRLSEASQAKLKQKAEKLGRFFERLTAIEIIVDLSDEQSPQVDIKVSAEHKHDFVAHEQSDGLMKAFESAVQKIEQQLRKYKERVQERNRNPQLRRQELSPADAEVDES
jgi:putative sigma-54 modulation protein